MSYRLRFERISPSRFHFRDFLSQRTETKKQPIFALCFLKEKQAKIGQKGPKLPILKIALKSNLLSEIRPNRSL